MDANQNPPSEREWTLEEQEEFFASQDAVTGLLSGGVANNGRSNRDSWLNLSVTSRGIHVISITPPESGWPMAIHCPLCRETTFFLSPFACKPTEDGKEFDGYHLLKDMCGNEEHAWEHNMKMGMKGWNEPIDLKPSPMLWWKL